MYIKIPIQTFTTLSRRQFTFRARSEALGHILKEIVARKINILSSVFVQNSRRVKVILVVGLDESTEKDNTWNNQVKYILRKHNVQYNFKSVIQVRKTGGPLNVPGVTSSVYNALIYRVTVYKFYDAETGDNIVQTSNNALAVKIITLVSFKNPMFF